MKKLYLWWHGAKKHILLDIVLIFAIVVSVFMLSEAVGIYRYVSLGNEKINSVFENEKAVYYMDFFSFRDLDMIQDSSDRRMEMIKELESDPCVKNVYASYTFDLTCDSSSYACFILQNEAMIKMLPELDEGEWFNKPVNEDGSINAVIFGTKYYEKNVGSDFLAFDVNFDELKIKVCGKKYPPTLIPDFSGSGTYVNTDAFFKNYNVVIVGESEEMWSLFREKSGGVSSNFFVDFHKDATDADIQRVYDRLSENGGYIQLSEIKKESEENLKTILKRTMILPAFYVVIAFVAFLSINILYVLRLTKSYAVYYLLGFSKRRMVTNVVAHTVVILLVSASINIAYVKNYGVMVMKGIVKYGIRPPIYDDMSVIIIAVITVIMLVVTLTATVRVLKKNSPSEFWNKCRQ